MQGDEWRLRGCIGNFEPMPLHDGLSEYALISAFKDSRFRKIDKSELERLECAYVVNPSLRKRIYIILDYKPF
jgi:AMMECR1 domain-containing protein